MLLVDGPVGDDGMRWSKAASSEAGERGATKDRSSGGTDDSSVGVAGIGGEAGERRDSSGVSDVSRWVL